VCVSSPEGCLGSCNGRSSDLCTTTKYGLHLSDFMQRDGVDHAVCSYSQEEKFRLRINHPSGLPFPSFSIAASSRKLTQNQVCQTIIGRREFWLPVDLGFFHEQPLLAQFFSHDCQSRRHGFFFVLECEMSGVYRNAGVSIGLRSEYFVVRV